MKRGGGGGGVGGGFWKDHLVFRVRVDLRKMRFV